MPHTNAIAGMITNITLAAQVEPANVEVEMPVPDLPGGSTAVQFAEGGGVAYVVADAEPVVRQTIGRLFAEQRPVYVTVSNQQILDVGIPIVGRVTKFKPDHDGWFRTAIDSSPRSLRVRDTPANKRVLDLLRTAATDHSIVMVMPGAANEVKDADPAPPEAWYLAPDFMTDEADELDDIAVTEVAPADLPRLFEIVNDYSCSVASAKGDCIPFDYPDSGCDARAHKMAQLLEAEGFLAGKVWLFDEDAFIPTHNAKGRCEISWEFHVAVYVRTAGPGLEQVHILDPSLFDKPVTLPEFIAALHTSMDKILFSRAEFYQLNEKGSGARPLGNESESILTDNRNCAKARDPQPPYCQP